MFIIDVFNINDLCSLFKCDVLIYDVESDVTFDFNDQHFKFPLDIDW